MRAGFAGVGRLFRCPRCGGNGLSADDDALRCTCGAVYPIRGSVVDFIDESREELPRSFTQSAMRNRPLIRIYDTFWRRLTFPFVTSIPLSREAKIILGYHALRPTACVLDIACGPGTYSRRFARAIGPAGTVVGVDASWPMLRQAARSAAQQGLENILLIRASAARLPFDDDRFDGINCTGALHLFEPVEPVLEKIRRMLRPGGVFSCMTFRKSPLGPLNAAFARLGTRLFDPAVLRKAVESSGLTFQASTASRLMLLFSARKPD
jgi:ubiquinone/menaquinone biosynthesis C-methylase UbiE